jgi:hypothetical protein
MKTETRNKDGKKNEDGKKKGRRKKETDGTLIATLLPKYVPSNTAPNEPAPRNFPYVTDFLVMTLVLTFLRGDWLTCSTIQRSRDARGGRGLPVFMPNLGHLGEARVQGVPVIQRQ